MNTEQTHLPSYTDMSLWLTTNINIITTKLIAEMELNMINDTHTFHNDRKIKHKNLPQTVNHAHLQYHCDNMYNQFQNELNPRLENLNSQSTQLSLNMNRGKMKHTHSPSPPNSIPRPQPRNLLQIASHNLIYKQLKNLQRQILFIDIETDGLPPKCEMLSICLTSINLSPKAEDSPNFNEEFYFIKPSPEYKINYHSQAYKINKISQNNLDNEGTTLSNIGDYLIQKLTENTIIGYNINSFDIPIIRKSLAKINKLLPPINTIDLYKAHHKMIKHDLSSALQSVQCYPIPEHLSHTATADTEACIRLMAALTEKMNLPKTISDYEENKHSPIIKHIYNKT
jgi:uncharacterized protein YprB with RNaseH-like and TPR domain